MNTTSPISTNCGQASWSNVAGGCPVSSPVTRPMQNGIAVSSTATKNPPRNSRTTSPFICDVKYRK